MPVPAFMKNTDQMELLFEQSLETACEFCVLNCILSQTPIVAFFCRLGVKSGGTVLLTDGLFCAKLGSYFG